MRRPKPARPAITQEMLARNYQAFEARRRIDESIRIWRPELLRLHDAGAIVEGGEFALTVEDTLRRRITHDILVPLIGAEAADDLRARIEPTSVRYLTVYSRFRRRTRSSTIRSILQLRRVLGAS